MLKNEQKNRYPRHIGMKYADKCSLLESNYLNFFALALAMLRDEEDARDAVQEAMVRVLTTRHIKDVVSYTFQTVRSCAIDIMRHRTRFVQLSDDVGYSMTEHEERLKRVGELREELPETMRALVELHDEEGYTYEELHLLTGMSVMTIRRRLEEAHTKIKNQMEKEI